MEALQKSVSPYVESIGTQSVHQAPLSRQSDQENQSGNEGCNTYGTNIFAENATPDKQKDEKCRRKIYYVAEVKSSEILLVFA